MRRVRVIPVLLVAGGQLVKTKKFKSPRYVGDPVNAIRIFNEKGVDELVICDISKDRYKNGPDMALIETMASEAFMPLGYAGGVTTMEQAEGLVSSGVEKIGLGQSLVDRPGLVKEMVGRYGAQSVVAAVDFKPSLLRGNVQYVESGKRRVRGSLSTSVQTVLGLGVGELWLTAMEREGTYAGYDTKALESLVLDCPVPVVIQGGAGSRDDMVTAVEAGASAVAVGSMFVYQRPHEAVLISYLKEEITVS